MTKATEPRQLGWLDANLFIHPLFQNDPNAEPCREIFRAIEKGTAVGWLDSVTVHELTYALQKVPQFRDNRGAIVDYLLPIVLQEGIRMSHKPAAVSALQRWARGGRFGDARIAALAEISGLPICTVNARDFPGLPNTFLESGAKVPSGHAPGGGAGKKRP